MTTTIRCAVCGHAITEHYHVFDHVTCTPPAPSPDPAIQAEAQQDAEQAFQVMREEFLEVQRTLHQDQGRR